MLLRQMALLGAFLPIWEKGGNVVGLCGGRWQWSRLPKPHFAKQKVRNLGGRQGWGALLKKITKEPYKQNARAPLETKEGPHN